MQLQMEIINQKRPTINKLGWLASEMNSLKVSTNIKDSDLSVYSSAHTGISLHEMNEKQLGIAITGTIFKIAVISGCPIPDGAHRKALEVEIKKFLAENEEFSSLTFEEICTAARFNAAGKFDDKVKHWQNIFNLDYLSEILLRWIPYKKTVGVRIDSELMKKNIFEPPSTPELSDNEAIQYARDMWSKSNDFMFIDSRVYEILTSRGVLLLDIDTKKRILEQARVKVEWITTKYYDLWWHEKYCLMVAQVISKKIAVSEYFKSLNNLSLQTI